MSDWRTLLDREIAAVGELPKVEKVGFQRPPLYHQTPPQMWAYSFGGNMRKLTLALLLTASSAGFLVPSRLMAQDATFDRTVLPISQPQAPTVTELDARNVTPPPPFAVKAPSKAPNVLIILLDDMGFGQPSAFGGHPGCQAGRQPRSKTAEDRGPAQSHEGRLPPLRTHSYCRRYRPATRMAQPVDTSTSTRNHNWLIRRSLMRR
jgi:hypothetical protein